MAKLDRKNGTTKKSTGTEKEKGVEINYPSKFTDSKRPTLVGYFSAKTNGLPVYGKVTLTDPNKTDADGNDIFNVMFDSKKYQDKSGNPKRTDYIFPYQSDGRKKFVDATVSAMEEFADLIEGKTDNEIRQISEAFNKTIDDITIRYPLLKENFPSQVGQASFSTDIPMILTNLELHEKADGTYFIGYPNRPGKDPDSGEKKYYPICGPMDSETAEAIKMAAVEAFEKL